MKVSMLISPGLIWHHVSVLAQWDPVVRARTISSVLDILHALGEWENENSGTEHIIIVTLIYLH